MTAPALSVRNLEAGYDGKSVVSGFNLDVAAGDFVSLLGPSGCGKTTILRAIAGFMAPLAGHILVDGADMTRHPPEARKIGVVFQNYALFPTMTAFENIAFGLRAAGRPGREVRERVEAIAAATGIAEHLARKPAALSGGQQQRVAIARVLVMESRILLFDEPLSNLDAAVRVAVRREIKRLQREIGFTAIFVTHDREEAMSLSDAIVVLNAGRVEQMADARTLYRHPATPFICTFMGEANALPTALAERFARGPVEGRAFLRPEDVLMAEDGLPATVLHVEFLGALNRVVCRIDDTEMALATLASELPRPGDTIHLAARPGSMHVFGFPPA